MRWKERSGGNDLRRVFPVLPLALQDAIGHVAQPDVSEGVGGRQGVLGQNPSIWGVLDGVLVQLRSIPTDM